VLRIDCFRDRVSERYLLNSVSGFEAEAEGVGLGDDYAKVVTLSTKWWFDGLDKLIKFHLHRIKHPLYNLICAEDDKNENRVQLKIFELAI
jgi:hypothetical protein